MKSLTSRILLTALALLLGLVMVSRSAGPPTPAEEENAALAPPETPTPSTLTLYAAADTYVSQDSPAANYGGAANLQVGMHKGLRQQILIRFNLPGDLNGASIQSATLRVYLKSGDGPASVAVSLCRAGGSWTEGGVTWNNRPGCTARESTSVGTQPGWYTWNAFNLLHDWLDGGYSNDGLCLTSTEGAEFTRAFSSREGGTAAQLVVTYFPATPTPTPSLTPTRTNTALPTPSATSSRTPGPSPTPSATLACPDAYEPNESFADARSLAAGEHQAYICSPGEQDWFSVSLSPGQPLRVSLSNLPHNYDLELYNPLGRLIAGSHQVGTTADLADIVASDPGAYRVRVLGVAGAYDAARPYTLKLELGPYPTATRTPATTPTPTATSTCLPDPYEPNNTLATAAAISPGTAINPCLCTDWDWDFFRFSVPAGREVRVRLSDLPRDYRLALFDPAGDIVAQAGGPGSEDRELSYVAPAAGEYRVRVKPGSAGDPRRTYTLRVDLIELGSLTLYAMDDTYVTQIDPETIHGSERRLSVGQDWSFDEYAYLRFGLSQVPLGAQVYSATLLLYLEQDAPEAQTRNLRVYRLGEHWEEEDTNFDNLPHTEELISSTAVGTERGLSYAWDVTAYVQGWLDGAWPNYGFGLIPEDGQGTFRRVFASSEYSAGMMAFSAGTTGTSSIRGPRLRLDFRMEEPGPLGSINGRAYVDANRNATYDPGETGISGARIELTQDRISQGFRITGADGTYSFSDLRPGTYDVQRIDSTLPAEYRWLSSASKRVWLEAGEHQGDMDFRVEIIPTPTPTLSPTPSTIDLIVEGVEFVQVVQGQPLITGKRTLARVYVRVAGTTRTVRGVSGRLYYCEGICTDWIEPVAAADILPSEDPMHDEDVVGDLRSTLNFLLPDGWTGPGFRNFYIDVNNDGAVRECAGCRGDNNRYATRAHGDSPYFRTAEALNVTMVAITVDGIAPTASLEETYRWLLQTYPINTVNVYSDSLTVTGYDLTDTSGSGCGSGWGAILSDLSDLVDVDGMYYYGMIGAVPHAYSGCGRRPGQVAAGFVRPGSAVGALTMAHEIGHNLGRRHSPCGGVAGPDPDYPYADAKIGVYGVDLANPASPRYVDPDRTRDIMSYCEPKWMSDYTYDALRMRFPPLASTVAQEPAEQEYLAGSGRIVNGLVTMDRPFYRLISPPGANDDSGEGRYTLELQDAGGAPLFLRHFDTVGDSVDPESGDGSFYQAVPWREGTARIVFREGQTVLLVIPVSAHAPSVTLLAPQGGEAWPAYGQRTVAWQGADADGDPLRYRLQYSTDGGATWRTIAADLTGTSYSLDLARLAGSDMARMRIIASDGVNTAQHEFAADFAVEGKPPIVSIIYPLDGATIRPGSPVILEAAATDLEDGPLTDDTRFTWHSSLEGELGVGRRLYFDDLLPGPHILTVRVSDGDRFAGEDSISLFVGGTVHLPALLKPGQ